MSVHVGTLGTVLVCSSCQTLLQADPAAQLALGPFGRAQPSMVSNYFDGQTPAIISEITTKEITLSPCSGCGDTFTVDRWNVILRLVVDEIPLEFDSAYAQKIDLVASRQQGKVVWDYANPVARQKLKLKE